MAILTGDDDSGLENASLYNKSFDCREQLIQYVKDLGRSQGFAVTIKKSSLKDGWVRLGCDRGGAYRRPHYLAKDAPVLNRKVSNLIGCPYEVRGRKPTHENHWNLEVRCLQHNHELCKQELESHSILRRLNQEEMEVVRTLTEAGVKPQDILHRIHQQFPRNLSTIKTIYDARKMIRQKAQSKKMKNNQADINFLWLPPMVPAPSHFADSSPVTHWPKSRPDTLDSRDRFRRYCDAVYFHWASMPSEQRQNLVAQLEHCIRGLDVTPLPNLTLACPPLAQNATAPLVPIQHLSAPELHTKCTDFGSLAVAKPGSNHGP